VRRSTATLAVFAVLALLAGACGAGGGGTSEAIGALNGDWSLTSGTGPSGDVDVGDGVEITLGIDGDEWGGTVCNSYGAQDVVVGGGTVTVGDVARTEMACLDDRLMAAEDAYLAAFTAVRAYEVTGDELRLTGDGTELRYTRAAPVAAPELVGTGWVLDTVFEGGGPDGSARSTFGDEEAVLELADDGTFTASSGCVSNDGDHELDGSRLTLSFAFDADYECGSEELWAQDTVVWRVLGSEPEVELDGPRLTLTAGDEGLGYRARDEDGA
jgi:heat shock protein HslJ